MVSQSSSTWHANNPPFASQSFKNCVSSHARYWFQHSSNYARANYYPCACSYSRQYCFESIDVISALFCCHGSSIHACCFSTLSIFYCDFNSLHFLLISWIVWKWRLGFWCNAGCLSGLVSWSFWCLLSSGLDFGNSNWVIRPIQRLSWPWAAGPWRRVSSCLLTAASCEFWLWVLSSQ